MSPIQDFYADQTIFLTGVTGFLGKLLVEKLLRSCPNVARIYLLVRPKPDKTVEERCNDIVNSPCFDIVKASDSAFAKKLHLLSGDCSQPLLGLTSEGITILKDEVTCIMHVAANVRFDTDLRSAVHTNVRSVRDLLNLTQEMKNLKAFVYVSTAFSHCNRTDVQEEFHDVEFEPEKLLDLVEMLDQEALGLITPHLLGKWPNTYVYTKAMAETLISRYQGRAPIAVVRPAIVTSSLREPLSGWNDNFHGIVGITLGCALGVLRSLHIDNDLPANIVPADFVVNNILAAAWDMSRKGATNDKIPIYNFIPHRKNFITWGDVQSCQKYSFKYAPSKSVWYPYVQCSRHKTVHNIRVFFYHTLFAYLVDAILLVTGRKPLAVEKYKKINKLVALLSFFTLNSWNFGRENVERLWDRLDEDDKKMFNFDMRIIDWDEYIETFLSGGRLHLLKDPPETIPRARRKMFFLAAIHYAFVGLVLYSWYRILSWVFNYFIN